MKANKFFNLIFNLVVSLLIAVMIAAYVPVPTPHVAIMAIGFFGICSLLRISIYTILLYQRKKLDNDMKVWMAVQTEVWENFIASNLFNTYEWIKRAKDRSAFVLNNAVVHIPQAGAVPKTSKNRENFPIPVVKRNDGDITYPIDELSTESTYIPDADKIELSYDKIGDVYMDHVNQLSRDSAEDILDRWYPSLSSKIVRTTGASIATHLAGTTGTRKKFMATDVEAAKTQLNLNTKRTKNPNKRALIMSEEMYNHLKADPALKDKDTMESYGAVWGKDSGDLEKVCGFDIIRTDVTGRYTNDATPVKKDYTLAKAGTYAASDNDVVLLVDFDKVHFALGDVKFFEGKDDVHFQGDIYNALLRFGGRKERADEVGVIAIVQDAGE